MQALTTEFYKVKNKLSPELFTRETESHYNLRRYNDFRISSKTSVEIGKKILRLKKNTTACYDSKFYLYNKTAKMKNIKNSALKSLVI